MGASGRNSLSLNSTSSSLVSSRVNRVFVGDKEGTILALFGISATNLSVVLFWFTMISAGLLSGSVCSLVCLFLLTLGRAEYGSDDYTSFFFVAIPTVFSVVFGRSTCEYFLSFQKINCRLFDP